MGRTHLRRVRSGRRVTGSLELTELLTSTPPAAGSSLDARATPARDLGPRTPLSTSRRRHAVSLLWRLFVANGSVLVVALLLLSLSPITIDAPIEIGQLALLLAGFAMLLGLNLLLLRRVLAPLFRLTEAMTSVDPDRPGRRLSEADFPSSEGQALAHSFNGMLDRLESARRDAARTALAAQEAERLRVAQELHDEIGQTLTAVTIQAERAADSDLALAPEALRRVADAVRDSLDEVRRIARELRPEALDDLGLVNALIALCSRVDAQGGLRVRRDLQGGLPAMSRETELVIYRVAQEGLTNALRHAEAATAKVSLKSDSAVVTLTVSDDGKGMPDELPRTTAGVAGMRERALLVGGHLSIGSRQGQGTEVHLTVPVETDGS
jgi:two-component system, NarL family, sensor histidine kinase UhpB